MTPRERLAIVVLGLFVAMTSPVRGEDAKGSDAPPAQPADEYFVILRHAQGEKIYLVMSGEALTKIQQAAHEEAELQKDLDELYKAMLKAREAHDAAKRAELSASAREKAKARSAAHRSAGLPIDQRWGPFQDEKAASDKKSEFENKINYYVIRSLDQSNGRSTFEMASEGSLAWSERAKDVAQEEEEGGEEPGKGRDQHEQISYCGPFAGKQAAQKALEEFRSEESKRHPQGANVDPMAYIPPGKGKGAEPGVKDADFKGLPSGSVVGVAGVWTPGKPSIKITK